MHCEAPGNSPCKWEIKPPTGEEEIPCLTIEQFVENKIMANQLTGQTVMTGVNYVTWSGADLNNYTFTVYTVAEAIELGLLN